MTQIYTDNSKVIAQLLATIKRLQAKLDPEKFRAFVNSTMLSKGDKDLLIGVFYDYLRQNSDE
ncbi:hypothetical protein [Pedobacter faecalis]|uniref:hypothetical protein n=1 Tax=Pedobacter faecalis TaxID=3041495 RepID=UPI00254FC2EA|nr:hypothetical protein [Pedobacter sp. ELA7]